MESDSTDSELERTLQNTRRWQKRRLRRLNRNPYRRPDNPNAPGCSRWRDNPRASRSSSSSGSSSNSTRNSSPSSSSSASSSSSSSSASSASSSSSSSSSASICSSSSSTVRSRSSDSSGVHGNEHDRDELEAEDAGQELDQGGGGVRADAPPAQPRVYEPDPIDEPIEPDPDDSDGYESATDLSSVEGEAKPNPKSPFLKKTAVYGDGNLTIFVQQSAHIQQRRFRAQDHMFDVTIEQVGRDANIPIMKSLQQIYKALKVILRSLKKFYLRKGWPSHRQVYCTVISKDMLRGLRTGNFDLATPRDYIARHIVHMLYYYLQSKGSPAAQLDSSFKINFKVLSHGTVARRKRLSRQMHGRGFSEDIYKGPTVHNGCSELLNLSPKERQCLFSLPNGYSFKPAAFENKCLLTSFVLAWRLYCSQTDERPGLPDQKLFTRLSHLRKYNKLGKEKKLLPKTVNAAGRQLQMLLRSTLQKLTPAQKQEYVHATRVQRVGLQMLNPLADKYQAQVHVVSSLDLKLKYSYPPQFDQSRHQLYIYQKHDPEEQMAHLYAITNLPMFFNLFGRFCVGCRKTKRTNLYGCFNCPVLDTCGTCHRPKLEVDTPFNNVTQKAYCNAMYDDKSDKYGREIGIPCSNKTCSKVLSDLICFGEHQRKKECIGERCGQCNAKLRDDIPHNCLEVVRKCRICQTRLTANHACPLKDPKKTGNWNRLAVLNIIFEDGGPIHCFDCQSFKEKLCQVHKETFPDGLASKTPPVALGMLFYESEQRELFKCAEFDCFSRLRKNLTDIECPYLPVGVPSPPIMTHVRNLANNRIPRKVNIDPFLSANHDRSSVLKRLLQFILGKLENYTILTNKGMYNSMWQIACLLYEHGLVPNVLQNDQGITVINVTSLGLRFVNSQQYFTLTDFELQSTYNHVKFFPIKFLHKKILEDERNYAWDVEVTDLFSPDPIENKILRNAKVHFYEKNPLVNLRFDLIQSSLATATCLLKAACAYIKENLILQQCLTRVTGKQLHRMLNPFNPPLTSVASAGLELYKNYGEWTKLRAVQKSSTGHQHRTSSGEYEWISWHTREFDPAIVCFSNYHADGPKAYQGVVPDLVYLDPVINKFKAYFFNGCWIHCHEDKNNPCPIMAAYRKKKDSKPLRRRGREVKTEAQVQLEDERKNAKLESVGIVVTCIWECHWNERKCSNKKIRKFVSGLRTHPKKRLVPRDAYFGGFVETLAYRFDQQIEAHKNYTFYADDKVSAYGSACINNNFPIGQYVIIRGSSNIFFNQDEKKYQVRVDHAVEELCGVAQVLVMPPPSLKFPFLLRRIAEPFGRQLVIAALCGTCPEMRKKGFCQHKDEAAKYNPKIKKAHTVYKQARHWYGTYTLSDINYAKTLGYDFYFFECYHYSWQEPIMDKFYRLLFQRRVLHSGFPSECHTEEEKETFCEKMNKELGLPHELSLSPTQIVPNKFCKSMYKKYMCEIVGKFGQKQHRTSHKFVSNYDEFKREFYTEGQEIDDIEFEDHFALLTITRSGQPHCMPRESNVIIAAYITSYNRIFMHKKMLQIEAKGGILFYTSTDSLYYALPRNIRWFLPTGAGIFDFQSDYLPGTITCFYSLGPKQTCITFSDASGKLISHVKVRGINLNSIENQYNINPNVLCTFLKCALQAEPTKQNVKVNQVRYSKAKNKYGNKWVSFNNNLAKRRNAEVPYTLFFTTIPFGYKRVHQMEDSDT